MPRTRRDQAQREIDHRNQARARVLECGRSEDDPIIEAAIGYFESMAANSAVPASTHLRDWLAYCHRRGWDPLEVESLQAKAYMRHLDGRYAPTTVKGYTSSIRGLYQVLMERGLVKSNPFRKVGSGRAEPKVPTPALTQEQFEQVASMLFAEAARSGSLTAMRNAVMFYVVGRLGPRRFEVSNATWASVGQDRGLMVIRIMGKGRKPATLTLPDDVIELMETWKARLEEAAGRPMNGRDGLFPVIGMGNWELMQHVRAKTAIPSLGTTAITEIFQNIFRTAGMGGARMSTHVGRATAATIAYGCTHDIVAVKNMLRHANIATTEGYLRHLDGGRETAGSWSPDVALPGRPDREAA